MSVFMFPGQGAQKAGMGADLLFLPEMRETCELASDITGVDAAALMQRGAQDEIDDALNAQVLTAVVSVGLHRALEARGVRPDAVLGFSLGQVSALMAAGVVGLEAGFSFLNARARAMARACAEHRGSMLALLGATHEQAQDICDVCAQGQVLVCANYNAPGQVVISGDIEAIERARAYAKGRVKRSVDVRTAGGFHSPLMAGAAAELRDFCAGLSFAEPRIPLICNTDARPFKADEAAKRLSAQVCSPVLFEQSVGYLVGQGCGTFIEVGYGGVLTGLVKRIVPSAERIRVGTRKEWDERYG